jgi:uncharacterized protein YdcH (DUF465 family)
LVQFKEFEELKDCVDGLINGYKTLDKKVAEYKTANNSDFKRLEDNVDSLNDRIIDAEAFAPQPNLVDSMIRVLEVGDIMATDALHTLISRGPND